MPSAITWRGIRAPHTRKHEHATRYHIARRAAIAAPFMTMARRDARVRRRVIAFDKDAPTTSILDARRHVDIRYVCAFVAVGKTARHNEHDTRTSC